MENFNRLPLVVRRRFVQITRRGADPTLIYHSKDGHVWLLLILLSTLPMAATAPVISALAGSWLAVPLMAGLMGLSVGLWVAAASWLYPTHPFAAGAYAFADRAVDCRANTFNMVRFDGRTVFQPYTHTTRRETRQGGVRRITTSHRHGVKILSGSSQTTMLALTAKSQAAATALAAQLDRARREFLGAWERGDHRTLQRMSPFYEDLVGQARTPGEATQPPLMRRIPLPLKAIGVLVVFAGVATGASAGYEPIRAEAAKKEDAKAAIAEQQQYEEGQAALAKELAASAAASEEAHAFLERMFDNASASQGVLYVDFRGGVLPTTGVPSGLEILGDRSYETLEEIMTRTLAQRLAGWRVEVTYNGAGPVIWVSRHVSPTSSRHPTAEGEVVGLSMVFNATVHWRTDDDDSAHEPLDVMMKLQITTQPPNTLPTNLSAHDTYEEMLKAEHEAFAAELIYRLVKKGKAEPTAKKKKKRKDRGKER